LSSVGQQYWISSDGFFFFNITCYMLILCFYPISPSIHTVMLHFFLTLHLKIHKITSEMVFIYVIYKNFKIQIQDLWIFAILSYLKFSMTISNRLLIHLALYCAFQSTRVSFFAWTIQQSENLNCNSSLWSQAFLAILSPKEFDLKYVASMQN